LVRPVNRAPKGPQVLQVLSVLQEQSVSRELLAHRVQLDLLDHLDCLVTLDQLERQVHLGPKAQLVLMVLLVPSDQPELVAQRVIQVQWVQPVLKEHLELLVYQDPQAS